MGPSIFCMGFVAPNIDPMNRNDTERLGGNFSLRAVKGMAMETYSTVAAAGLEMGTRVLELDGFGAWAI